MTAVELENLQQRMENDKEQNSDENKEERVGHNCWCLCRRCPLMATAKELVCCDETREATERWIQKSVSPLIRVSNGSVWTQKFCELCLLPCLMCALTVIWNLSNCIFSDWLLTGNLPGGFTAYLVDQFGE